MKIDSIEILLRRPQNATMFHDALNSGQEYSSFQYVLRYLDASMATGYINVRHDFVTGRDRGAMSDFSVRTHYPHVPVVLEKDVYVHVVQLLVG